MRRLAIIYFIFLSFFGQAQNLSAFVDYGRFKINDTVSYVEIYLGIEANSVEYKKNENGKLQSQVFTSLKIYDDEKVIFFDNFNVKSPELKSEKPAFKKFNFSKRIFTENKKYTCELKIRDQNSTDTANTIEFEINNTFESEKILYSDIQLLEGFEATNVKNDIPKLATLLTH